MTRKKRVPLQLKGSDEKYFRTREIQTRPAPETPPEATPETGPDPRPQQAPKPQTPPKPAARAKAKPAKEPKPATPEPVTATEPDPGASDVVSRIVPLGRALSTRVQDLAAALDVPVDDLLYAARKRAVARVRAQLTAARKPDLPEVIKGGETIRIALKLSAPERARLTAWFDPLDLGLATKPLAPLLAGALRTEVALMCDAAG